MAMMTGAHAVVRELAREGVEVVFGLPGVQIMPLYDAFWGQDAVRLLTVRHEQTTVYMADGYARTAGRPGVALVVPGPGVQNASAALGTAYACSSPVLLVAGQIESAMLGQDRGALHEINDQLEIVRPITKWSRRVLAPADVAAAIHEGLRQAQGGRSRPTVVEIPPDVLAAEADVALPALDAPSRAVPDVEPVRRAAQVLAEATRPLIWAGGGVVLADAAAELTALAEALGIPVATTAEGKGAIPEDHPLALGVGYYGHGAPGFAAPRADVVLAVGTRLTGQMYGPTALRSPQRLIHLDVDPAVIGKNYPAEVAIVGDARPGLRMLRDLARALPPRERWPGGEVADVKRRGAEAIARLAPLQCELIDQLQGAIDDEAIVVSGITNVGYWANIALKRRRPRTYLTASYFATLGFAFPTALGAKVAAPQRTVVSLSGDGGFMYALPELATAVQHGLDVVAIVFVDGAFGASKNDQRTRYAGRLIGTELRSPSFAKVAEVFGAHGIRAEPHELGKAVQAALEARRPAVVEVPIPTLPPPFQLDPPVA